MRSFKYLLAVLVMVLALPAMSFAQVHVGIAVGFGPPPIPVYEQPICPGDGYLWTPGYWAWDPDVSDYYWVPGTWIMAPEVGFLWTPGWWGWGDGGFFWNDGFWGPTVGFYGGINYGFGYFGTGFYGGRWDHGHFFYNTAVMRVDKTHIHNVYNTRVENVNEGNRVSYNGGEGGLKARPTPEEEAASHERHIAPTAEQTRQAQTARSNPDMRSKANHGDPPVKATPRAGDFSGARGGAGERTETGAAGEHAGAEAHSYSHASDLPPLDRPQPAGPDATKAEKKYQKQQQKLYDQQQKERDKLAKQQEKEHQKRLNDQEHQQMEQRHAQETQQMQQRHEQQRQELPAARARTAGIGSPRRASAALSSIPPPHSTRPPSLS